MPTDTSYRKSGQTATPSFVAEYKSPYNEITQPNKLVFCSQYFVDRWMPLLGGVGTRIVLALRRKCWHDRETGQHREEVKMSLAELAKRVGCSVATLKREFADNDVLSCFVQSERRFKTDENGKSLRDVNTYHVFMDDPAHEDDEKAYREKEEARDKGEQSKAQNEPFRYAKARSRAQIKPLTAQDEPSAIQNDGSTAHSEPQTVQNAPTLSDTLLTSDTLKDTLDTPRDQPTPPQDTQAVRSFSFQGEEKKEPDDGLTPLQRAKMKNPELFRAAREKGKIVPAGEGAGK